MNLLLKNISWMRGHECQAADVRVRDGVITEIGDKLVPKADEIPLDYKNHFLYPGLINSHDHLEMNLYPRMGNPPYQNYTQWAKNIYRPKESPVKEIERVDIEDRLMWGGIKNLISGVTTVVHHNPWHRILSKANFPVRVIETAWAHSLAFEKNILKKFPKDNSPFVIHAAEGTDEFAESEISKLSEIGLLRQNTVLIHAIGLNQKGIELSEKAKSSLVWCPSSNLFMFEKTLPLKGVKGKLKIALGSDSTMTGPATLLHEMRLAASLDIVPLPEVYEMVTTMPAKVFQLDNPDIQVGKPATFWIAPVEDRNYLENIFCMEPSKINAVFVNGELRYGDLDLSIEVKAKGFQVAVEGKEKWCAYDIRTLKKRIDSKTKGACRDNSLWQLLS